MTTAPTIPGDWWPDPLPENIVVGERCYLYSSFAFLHYRSTRPIGVRIGDDTGVYEGTVFDLGPEGEVTIGKLSTIVAPTFSTNGSVTIGDYAFISNDVFFADVGAPVPPDAGVSPDATPKGSRVTVGDNVWIGARVVLLDGAELGEGAIVGAGSVVDFSVPPYAVVAGNPARIIGSSPPRPRER